MANFGNSTFLYMALFLSVVAAFLSVSVAVAQDAAPAPIPDAVAGNGFQPVISNLLTFSPMLFYFFTILLA